MSDNFLEQFIKKGRYLQNPPIETKAFISFCKKKGIMTSEKELEFFEKEKLLFPLIRIDRPIVEDAKEIIGFQKDGKEKHPSTQNGLKNSETEAERCKIRYYSSYDFDDCLKPFLINWLEEGNLFNPADKPFSSWRSFQGERLRNDDQRIISFYSSFQIYWLEYLKAFFMCNINFANMDFSAETCKNSIEKLRESRNRLKDRLQEEYENFNQFLHFLLSIQNVYYPYVRSDLRTIRVEGDNEEWHRLRETLNLGHELENSELNIDDIGKWYKALSDKSRSLLGVTRDDWMQLWKNISWDKKDKLEGGIRLGIEYLQWVIMLKRVIEDYLGREILDIDEIGNIAGSDVLKFPPSEEKRQRISTRAIRNERYSDPKRNKNYYYDEYKRLFYMANDFHLDYQPRVAVFVEGKTEEKVFPKVFEWYYKKPEDLGIEFVNFEGVNKLISTYQNMEKLKCLINELSSKLKQPILLDKDRKKLYKSIKELQKNVNIIISNWTSFLSYNLEKWQIIPFFISDDEGNIKHFLTSEKPIRFEGGNYNVPQHWCFLWGDSNNNTPFAGKSFELANFSDQELSYVLTEVLCRDIKEEQIRKLRYSEEAIKAIDGVEWKKVEIAEKLFNYLFDMYEKDKNDAIMERPIFRVIEKIVNLTVLNHPPTDRQIELENKEYIKKELSGETDMEKDLVSI